MVFVTVGEYYASKFVLVFSEVGEVGQDQVYARHLFVREGHASVDKDYTAVLPYGSHIFADLPQSAQGNDLQSFAI